MRKMDRTLLYFFASLFVQALSVSVGHFPTQASSSPTQNTFRVYLVDDQTGQPVEKAFGVFVSLLRMSETGSVPVEERHIQFSKSAERLGGGVYYVENLEYGRYVVWVRAEGYALALSPVDISSPGPRREVVRLERPGLVRGIVVDGEGNPIPRAEIGLSYTDEEFLTLQSQIPTFGGIPGSATTNEFGEYLISDYVRPGWSFAVEVNHKEYLPVLSGEALVAEGQVATLNVVLTERGKSVEGRVVDDQGQPVGGANVLLQSLEKRPDNVTLELSSGRRIPFNDQLFSVVANKLWMRYRHMTTRSGADGTFSIPGLPAGSFKMRVMAEGFETTYRKPIEVNTGRSFVQIVLTRKNPE